MDRMVKQDEEKSNDKYDLYIISCSEWMLYRNKESYIPVYEQKRLLICYKIVV